MKQYRNLALALLVFLLLPGITFADAPPLKFTKLWTYKHAVTPGGIEEIPAFDHRTNTIWVAGIVGVDVIDADKGTLIEHIDTTPYGTINSSRFTTALPRSRSRHRRGLRRAWSCSMTPKRGPSQTASVRSR